MRRLRLLLQSLQTLTAHRGRSLLVVLAVAVGIGCVFVSKALSGGAQAQVLRAMAALGADLLIVRPAEARRLASRKAVRGQVTTLRLEDAEAIGQLELVADAAPAMEGMASVRSGTELAVCKVIGTTSAFLRVRRFVVDRGRFFGEDEARSRVAVIGARVQQMLYPGQDPVGQPIRIRGVPFEIVGTLRAKGAADDGADHDSYVVVPVRTAQRRVFHVPHLNVVFVRTRAQERLDEGESRIRELLRDRHKLSRRALPDDFAVQNQQKVVQAQQQAGRWLTLVAATLTGVALLIGGLGMVALMTLSIRERTPEIGLRMALGARPFDIFVQFLAEAMTLSLLGGALGVGLGRFGAAALPMATGWPVRVAWDTALTAFGAAIALGFCFGVLPSRSAARLPPVEALARE